MLKRLSRKFFILFALVAALTAVPSSPASSSNRILICYDVPICYGDCCSGYWCCDRSSGECFCG
jgi:hypothetical protein